MPSPETQASLLDAARDAFAEKGFSGARVDAIARRARANKAMIYYHFRSKEGLYAAVLQSLLEALRGELAAAAAREAEPGQRLAALYAGLAEAFRRQPALPRIMLQEMLGGGRHLQPATARALGSVFELVLTTLEEGVRRGAFRRVHPLLVHLNMVGTLLIYSLSGPFRARVRASNLRLKVPEETPEELIAYLRDVLRRTLAPDATSGARHK